MQNDKGKGAEEDDEELTEEEKATCLEEAKAAKRQKFVADREREAAEETERNKPRTLDELEGEVRAAKKVRVNMHMCVYVCTVLNVSECLKTHPRSSSKLPRRRS